MAAIEPVDVKYTPNLPKEVITSGKLSSAQIEPIIYAGQAHSEFLPGGQVRRGYFIGDGTGVGKGREISGIMLDNQRQGRDKHLWISAKSGLINDARRDFGGIGANPDDIFALNDTKAADTVKAKRGVLFASYDTLKSAEKAPPVAGVKKGAAVKISGEQAIGTLVSLDKKTSKATVAFGGSQRKVPYGDIESIGGNSGWNSKAPAKARSRVDQIVDWVGPDFDGVIAFDEAHNMGNLGGETGARGAKEASQKALSGVELQTRLPKARVVYVSATGATEVSNLMFAHRLGLWGENTSFATPTDFAAKISAAGIASMELVARDLKAQGSYIARSLSFEGVGYDRLEAPLSPLNKEIYNELATAWQGVLEKVNEALVSTGQDKDGNAKGAAKSQFWGTHQRFFNQVITAMQTPAIIDRALRDIEDGKSPVFQLVNTNEATQERLVDRAMAEGTALEELDFTPRQSLIEYVKRSFPVQKFEVYADENGKPASRPVTDSSGAPVLDKAAVAARDELLAKLETIRVPNNPIDEIIKALGVDNVAEVTGRGRRFVQENDDQGGFKIVEQKRGVNSNRADADAFMGDRKRALIFSDAGGTGYSFQSDLGAVNQRQRVHYLVQPGWRADNAVQGFGRTHRSNEANQPEYVLPQTDLKAQRRFISSIARRLDQLGALTKGQRNTGSQGLFTASDNLESKYAKSALRSLIEDMAPNRRSRVKGGVLDDSEALIKAMGFGDIYDEKTGAVSESKMPEITQFLNRLLSLRTDQQDALFSEFENRMDANTNAAIQAGTFDDGMQTIKARAVEKVRDEPIFVDPRTNATTRYVEFNLTNDTRLNDWDAAQAELEAHPGQGAPTYYADTKKGKVFAVVPMGERLANDGTRQLRGYRVGVDAGQSAYARGVYINNRAALEAEPRVVRSSETNALYTDLPYRKLTPEAAKSLWAIEYDKAPQTYNSPLHMLTGVLLPVWDRIQAGDSTSAVARLQTQDGERFIGRVLPEKFRADILKNFGVGAIKADTPTTELLSRIHGGETAQLSNGWLIKQVRVSNEPRLEITASYISGAEQRQMENQGAIVERINYRERIFIPSGPAEPAVFDKLTRDAGRPVVDFQKAKDANDERLDLLPSRYQGLEATKPVFYSALSREIVNAPFSKSGEIDSRMLSNWLAARSKDGSIKRAEIEATGLDDYLKLQGGKVSRDTVQQFLDQNGVKVTETMLGDKTLPPLPEGWKIEHNVNGFENSDGGESEYAVVNANGEEQSYGFTPEEAHEAAIDGDAHSDAGVKFAGYTLPGGENYRELLLTLPSKGAALSEDALPSMRSAQRASDRAAGDFRSGHFEQPNILAHVRFNERTDAEGRKVLFIEELQSDWAQQGKKRGFAVTPMTAEQRSALVEEHAALGREVRALMASERASGRAQISDEGLRRRTEINDRRQAIDQQIAAEKTGAVPTGPFVGKTEAWVGLAMKRMIRYAAENGYDRVAFTNGEQQAARYKLSTEVNSIEWSPAVASGSTHVILDTPSGLGRFDVDASGIVTHVRSGMFRPEQVVGKRLDEIIGKGPADKILGEYRGKMEGEGLNIGGEGMTAFYDKIVPNVTNDVLKKLGGGRVGEVEIPGIKEPRDIQVDALGNELPSSETSTQPGFDITPKMRDAVLGGQPQFDAATGRGTSALDQGLHMMASEGTTAQPILERIASTSTNPLNVVVARALQATGVDSTVQVGRPDAGRYSPDVYNRIAGSYKNATDTVTITRPANAEKHLLHEIVHAATVEAINRNTIGARQLDALVRQVRESGLVDLNKYGMSDNYEFIAEAMSNPDFQNVLKNVPIRTDATTSNAWQGFVRLVARLLGMKDTNALLEAMTIGTKLFDETSRFRDEQRAARERPQGFQEWADTEHADVVDDPLNAPRRELGGESLMDKVKHGVSDRLTDTSPFGWWNKTVGTQYQKAMQSSHFKAVFDIGQRFLHDVSAIALRSADAAPTLLPKINANLPKAIRNAVASARAHDVEKLSGPIFEGTLNKRVFSADELKNTYGLSDRQIQMYNEFRQSTNQSLNDLLASEAARLARGKVDPAIINTAKQDPFNAPRILNEALRAAGHDDIANDIDAKQGRIQQLQSEGYAPLSRFGQYTVYVTGKDGSQQYFSMHESKREANAKARELAEAMPDSTVVRGELSQRAFELFRGISPDTLEIFADALGVGDKEVFQEYLKRAVNNTSTLKRLIERKGIAGYSQDVPRVLATFITSNSRSAAKNYHMADMADAVNSIPHNDPVTGAALGKVKDEAVDLMKYIQNPQKENGLVRGLLFTNYIGGSVASAITNLTQIPLQTIPYLTQWGAGRAASAMAAGLKIALRPGGADPELAALMRQAEDNGVLGSPELHQLYAETDRGFAGHPVIRSAAALWGAPFAAAESFNRRATFAAAYEIAKTMSPAELHAAGVEDVLGFATKAVEETQGIYNRGNRPNWARGAVGATLFTFKQFSVSYIEFVNRLPPQQKAIALAALVMAAGTQGLPFANDIEDVIDTIGQSMGYDTNSKRAFREGTLAAATKLGLGDGVGKFINQGASSIPGMPIDMQGRLGLSNLIPGIGMFKRSTSTDDKQQQLLEVIGPLGQFISNLSTAVAKGQAGDWTGAARSGLPLAIQNAIAAHDMLATGVYRDSKGRTVAKTTDGDAFVKGLGFQPTDVSLQREKQSEFYQQTSINQIVKDQIVERWARGVFERDSDKVTEAIEALRQWNAKNPDNLVRIPPTSIHQRVQSMYLTADQRTIKSAPKQLRGDAIATLR